MDMVIPDLGKAKWLNWALVDDGTDQEDFVVELYSNDYVPDDDSEFTDFDSATFAGYAAVPVARADFSAPVIVGHVAESEAATAPEYSCTGGSPQDCYGWFMYTADGMVVVAAQRFDSVRSMAPGTTEKLDPFKIKLKTFA